MNNSQARLWLIPLGALALAGCVDTRAYAPAGVDPKSTAADIVRSRLAERQPYPDLRRLPAAPKDVPAPKAFAAQAAAQRAARARLQAWVAAHPPEVADTEAYAGLQRARVPDPARDAPADDQAARSEAWAARLRQVAKPPPPPST